MGLCGHDLDLLLDARERGASFDRTLTVGHLDLYLLPGDRRRLARRAGNAGRALDGDAYADRVFTEVLGARDLVVLDNSDYEGAGLVHDLNAPIPPEMEQQFDAVVDGGTIEHVFDVRTALANLMKLVKVGGSVYLFTAANNLCGHGFYQFSPELMYRAFSRENGFEVRSVRLVRSAYPSVQLTRARGVYEVADPATLGERVMLVSSRPTNILVWATRTAAVEPFRVAPQQSDYVARWSGAERAGEPAMRGVAKRLAGLLPGGVRRRAQGWYELARFRLGNRRYFRPLARD